MVNIFRTPSEAYRVGDDVVSATNGLTWYGEIIWILGPLMTVRKVEGPGSGKVQTAPESLTEWAVGERHIHPTALISSGM